MIDRPLISPTNGLAGLSSSALIPVDPDAFSVTNPDGSADVFLGERAPASIEEILAQAPFSTNLANRLPDNLLGQIASDIQYAVEEDKQGRRDWEDALTKGMDLLGIKDEQRTTPWPGSCGVVHPMIMEAAVRFQSKSITRLFPATGPADAKVVGESNTAKIQQAKRVAADIHFR